MLPIRSAHGLAAAALGALSAGAHAQVFDATTYQGLLEEDGQPAEGVYDVRYQIFDSAQAQIPLESTTIESLQVTDGLLMFEIDTATLGVGDASERRFLGVGVRPGDSTGGYTELLPRQELRAAPGASRAALAFQAEAADFALATGATLQDVYDNGQTIDLGSGPLELTGGLGIRSSGGVSAGASGFPGFFDATHQGGGYLARLRAIADGGALSLRDDNFTEGAFIRPDISNGGGFAMRLDRNGSGNAGFNLDTNHNSTQAPRLDLTGLSSAFTFDTSVTGPGTLVAPTDAVNAREIFDEPGVALDRATPNTNIIETYRTFASRTLTAPTSGYVIVIGSMEVEWFQSSLGVYSIDYGISTDGGVSIANGMDYTYAAVGDSDNNAGEDWLGVITLPFTDVVPVSAGAFNARLIARHGPGYNFFDNPQVRDVNMVMLFVPTSYGTIALAAPDAPDTSLEPRPLTESRLAAEFENELRRAQAQADAERAVMLERIEALERMLRRQDARRQSRNHRD
ncbi:MAG: hypothetical protein ACF8Q5_14550 [Phycisphaerales bacterium JB040]